MKALFVGLGSIGQRHLRNLCSLEGDNVEISAVRKMRQVPMLDQNRNVIKDGSLSDHYGITEFSDIDKALEKQPDVVFVTNPSSMHLEVAEQAALAGSHLFIEKPLHSSLEGIGQLIKTVDRQGLVALVAYQLRFHPGLQQVSKWLESKRIGDICSAHITHGEYLPNFHPYEDYKTSYASREELGGGVLLTQIHEFDYAKWLFGRPSRIFSLGGKLSHLTIDVEDTASVVMECSREGGSFPVSVCLDYLRSPAQRSCVIVGTNGRISIDFYGKKSAELETLDSQETEICDFSDLDVNVLFMSELKHFLGAVRGGITPIVDLRSGFESLEMALSARESLKTGRIITLD